MNGVLYIAFGERYREEAKRSIASLRRVSPGVKIAVVTSEQWRGAHVPDEFILREGIAGFRSKPVCITESPFARSLFIDTDTIVARDIEPVFGLLDHYDVGVRFDGPQLREPDGLELHTQCNSGVFLFRRNAQVEEMLALWLRLFDAALRHIVSSDVRGLNDQRYLAIAIARSKVRAAHLGSFMNFSLTETITTYSPPLIYHGRIPGMETLHDELSGAWDVARDWHVRLWLPNIRGLLPAGVRRSDPLLALALIFRRAWNSTKRSALSILRRRRI